MPQILRRCGAGLALAVALIAVSLNPISGEGIAGGMALNARAMADVAIDTDGLPQTRWRLASGLRDQILLPGGLEYFLRASHGSLGARYVRNAHIPRLSTLGSLHDMYATAFRKFALPAFQRVG